MQRNRSVSNEIMESIPSKEGISAAEWLAEQMPGGFFIYRADESMELLYVNQSTCDIFGCSSVDDFRELTGNSFKGMVHPEDYDSIQTSIEEQIARPSNRRNIDYVVYRIIRKDGKIRWVDDYGHFAKLPGYGDVYYVFIEDITEHREAEEEKERVRNLSYALEQAEQANLSKSAFLSNMSHEIRTPITAILGMNEMIQRETENSVILEYSENIRKAGVSLLGIISDILDFSKIETGKMSLEQEEYSISSIVMDLYNIVQIRAEAKGLELVFKVDPNLPSHLIGDEIRVKQIITNLLTNAVKYTESGSVTFEISLLEKMDDAVTFSVSVTDTGIGIREEDMARLFEPFDRLDLKKTRTIEGTGLGLAITKELLSIMGSKLEVESHYEKGSRFTFTLTQKVSDWTLVGDFDPNSHAEENSAQRRKNALFTAPGLRLLVVDDTPMNLQVVAGLLKRTRMHIDVATSGKECIEKFGKENYDLVFLDYRMPQMNGIETLTVIKNEFPEKFARTPVISLTASAVSGDKEKMIKAGFTDYLSKPVNIDEMERMMIKYLPQDSVILCEESPDMTEDDDELKKLPRIIFNFPELDPERGIEYCGDAEDYMFAIETYAVSIDAKAAQIEGNLKDDDIDNYTINVHSLKSTSGAIGATELSEMAKALEQAGKDKDIETIKMDTPKLLEKYRNLKGILNDILRSHETSDDSSRVQLAVVEEEKNRMLSLALEEAERANLAKTAFLSNMSHEIRTPMNDIIGLYNIALRKPDLDEETKDIVGQIGHCARQLIALINDILDISLIESGGIVIKNEEFSFGSVLEQINAVVESQCEDKKLVYDCSVIGHLHDYYCGDDMKLKQIIFNILSNAVKYTAAPGKITMTVEEVGSKNDEAMIRFVISDTGVGIDPELLPHIFEPFPLMEGESAEKSGNTGLGMAITKKIVDMMGGEISAESRLGKGTSFTVVLPLKMSSTQRGDKYSFTAENIRALVVDDDITACEHAKMILHRVGIEAEYVLNGKDALEIFRAHGSKPPFNLLLVDWKMPGMDGIELTRLIRQSAPDEDVAIVLTTYNWYEIMEEAFRAGVDGFIAKPVFAGSIRDELDKIFAEKKKNPHRALRGNGLAGSKFILAEDMELNGRIMEQLLAFKGIEVDIAANGEEAVEFFEKSKEGTYDAILMDIRMPRMNGLEATKKIRSLERRDAKSIPIIALTANAFPEDVRLSLDAGMNAHLSKPIEPNELFSVIKSLIL